MHRFIALLSLCVFIGMRQSADAQTRSGAGTRLNDRSTARDNRRVMPAPNQRFVQEAVRRAKERQTRMETRKRLGISLARPTVYTGPAAMLFHPYSNSLTGNTTRRRSYGRRFIGVTQNNSSPRWEYYSSPYLWSPLHLGDTEQFPLQRGLQRSPAK